MIVMPIAEKEEVKKRVGLGHLTLNEEYIVFGLNFNSSKRKVSIYSKMHHALVLYDGLVRLKRLFKKFAINSLNEQAESIQIL